MSINGRTEMSLLDLTIQRLCVCWAGGGVEAILNMGLGAEVGGEKMGKWSGCGWLF